jgi:hypothetical protein
MRQGNFLLIRLKADAASKTTGVLNDRKDTCAAVAISPRQAWHNPGRNPDKPPRPRSEKCGLK